MIKIFIDIINNFKAVVQSDEIGYCLLNNEKFSFQDISMSIKIFDDFSALCLSEFRRGYDKPALS